MRLRYNLARAFHRSDRWKEAREQASEVLFLDGPAARHLFPSRFRAVFALFRSISCSFERVSEASTSTPMPCELRRDEMWLPRAWNVGGDVVARLVGSQSGLGAAEYIGATRLGAHYWHLK